jgi:hypothetical protein
MISREMVRGEVKPLGVGNGEEVEEEAGEMARMLDEKVGAEVVA